MLADTALFSALLSRLTALACGSTWVTSLIARFFFVCFLNIQRSGVHTALAWLVPHETAVVSARSVYTKQPCTVSIHANHVRKVHACFAVTCHLHFWQNDQGILHATAVTRGWNGYRNKVQWTGPYQWQQHEHTSHRWIGGCGVTAQLKYKSNMTWIQSLPVSLLLPPNPHTLLSSQSPFVCSQ